MFGFKKPKPEIIARRIDPTHIRVEVKIGGDTHTAKYAVQNLFPEVADEFNKMQRQLKTKQLPTVNHWHVLGCLPTKDAKVVNAAFRKMSMVYHPDQGGNKESFATLTVARDTALKQCN